MSRYVTVLPLIAVLALSACGTDERVVRGEAVYNANCKVCHAQGINGAPIVGNIKMWGPRLGQGHDVLVAHATSGFGLMPARAGNPDLSDEDISNAIHFMRSKLEQ